MLHWVPEHRKSPGIECPGKRLPSGSNPLVLSLLILPTLLNRGRRGNKAKHSNLTRLEPLAGHRFEPGFWSWKLDESLPAHFESSPE